MFGFAVSAILGVCLGFGFGVGCALATLYGIYMRGYRAALRDAQLPVPSKRYVEEVAKTAHQG